MKSTRTIFLMLATLAAFGIADGGTVRERWAGRGASATHPGTLKVISTSAGTRLVFDLSALPKDAKIHHASLHCTTDRGQPVNPVRVYMVDKLGARGVPGWTGKRLALEAPWYRSFDVTDAVRAWVKDPAKNLGLVAVQFENLKATRTSLDVMYEGEVEKPGQQVGGLRAVHANGQTFVIWREVKPYHPKAKDVIWVTKFAERGDTMAEGPGKGAHDLSNHPAVRHQTIRDIQGLAWRSGGRSVKIYRVRKVPDVCYRVYRHTAKITPANIHQAKLLAEVKPLSGFDTDVYATSFHGEFTNQKEVMTSTIPTFRVGDGTALTPGEGLYVHTAKKGGGHYYAVTSVWSGTEDMSTITDANSLAKPVAETPGKPVPILQWVQTDRYRKDPPEYWYRFWAAPPYYHLPMRSFRVAIAVSDKVKGAKPMLIGGIQGKFNIRGNIRLPKANRVTLSIQAQLNWLPQLFFNEGSGTLRAMSDCKVDYYPEQYMAYVINWAMGKYEVDKSRVSGSYMHFGLRHPDIFTRMQMGTYTTAYDVRWAPGSGSMPSVIGPRGTRTARGEDAWAMYNVGDYVKLYPARDIPFLMCISGTGKDGGHTSEFGWQDDPRGWYGLNQGRQTFVATWSCSPPRELSQGLNKVKWGRTIPAFSNCSIDNNPGNGDPTDGDYYGMINGWLLWDNTAAADEPGKWSMPVWLISACPRTSCTVDVTPRWCGKFKPKAGEKFKWTNVRLSDNKTVASGKVAADKWGLVTLKGVTVTKDRNLLTIEK